MADKPIFDLGPLHDEEAPDIGSDIGSEPSSAPHDRRDLQHVRRRSQAKKDKRTGLFLAAGLIIVALGALVAVSVLTGDDPLAQDESTDLAGPANGPDAPDGPGPTSGADDSQETASEGVSSFEPPTADHLRADEIASLFETNLNSDGNRYGIAYVANDEFVVLDHRGITLPELEIAVEFQTVSNLALLTNDGRTWAVNPVDRERNYLVSNSYVVVVSERPGTIAIIRPDDQAAISLMSSALPVPSVELPEGATLLWAQGRGPLVMPRTGGTFELAGIASSLTRISDDRAVAASLHGTVYESCDDLLTCSYFSQIDDGPSTALPFTSGTDFTISPDGKWVIGSADDSIVVFDVDGQIAVLTLSEELTAVDWAPNSSFVAIVAGDVLTVAYPTASDEPPVRLRLNQIPDLNSLLVFQG